SLDGERRGRNIVHEAFADFGEYEDVRAPIRLVGRSPEESARREPLNRPTDRDLVHQRSIAELLLDEALLLGQHGHNAPLWNAEAEPRLVGLSDEIAYRVARRGQQERYEVIKFQHRAGLGALAAGHESTLLKSRAPATHVR